MGVNTLLGGCCGVTATTRTKERDNKINKNILAVLYGMDPLDRFAKFEVRSKTGCLKLCNFAFAEITQASEYFLGNSPTPGIAMTQSGLMGVETGC